MHFFVHALYIIAVNVECPMRSGRSMKCNIARRQRLPGNRRDHCLHHACVRFSPLHFVRM